ncbi:phosphotransferase [Taibaiella lutea]|uniref:Phosphotransferase n=1 Tax=Taibaiella lutea TaxID=2608001 RepID=A0A5M6CFK5_9BACT|nr:phosphotransferase [Taibaiella lutea]KAA5532702.1 phosphotransferase [Taibaiella lutea]
MEIFPAQYSTLSASALNIALQKAYGLNDTTCRLLIRNVSDTYILENETSKYIFKIYRDAHRSLEEIKGELALLNVLKENGAKVAYPITDLEGQQIQHFQAIEGIRNGVLFAYAKGEVAYNLSDEQLALLGTEMAKIHNITSSVELPFYRKEYNVQTTLFDPIKVIRPAFGNLEAEYEYLNNTVSFVAEEMSKLDINKFGYGYCHYDFLPKNFHFENAENITFFDFDFAGKGYLINDITSFFIHYFLENVSNKISVEEAKRCFAVFVAHYSAIRSLSDDELKSIKLFGFGFWMFYFQFHFEQFDDWSSIFFNERFIKGRVALIKQWMEWDF